MNGFCSSWDALRDSQVFYWGFDDHRGYYDETNYGHFSLEDTCGRVCPFALFGRVKWYRKDVQLICCLSGTRLLSPVV